MFEPSNIWKIYLGYSWCLMMSWGIRIENYLNSMMVTFQWFLSNNPQWINFEKLRYHPQWGFLEHVGYIGVIKRGERSWKSPNWRLCRENIEGWCCHRPHRPCFVVETLMLQALLSPLLHPGLSLQCSQCPDFAAHFLPGGVQRYGISNKSSKQSRGPEVPWRSSDSQFLASGGLQGSRSPHPQHSPRW